MFNFNKYLEELDNLINNYSLERESRNLKFEKDDIEKTMIVLCNHKIDLERLIRDTPPINKK